MALFVLLGMLIATSGVEARSHLWPDEFQPLTSLPWKQPGATVDSVLETIFHEPNIEIRYPVLAKYLRLISVDDLPDAFEKCIDLEGIQTPDQLVELFLRIWAERDPHACWKRTQELFGITGFEGGWLGLDSWLENSPIVVQDIQAFQASRFWLDGGTLISFPFGVNASGLPRDEAVGLMRAFAERWFAEYGTWPGYESGERTWSYFTDSSRLMEVFESALDSNLETRASQESREEPACFELAMRRQLEANPASALKIMQKVREHDAKLHQSSSAGVPWGLLMVWARFDLPGLIQWAGSSQVEQDDNVYSIRGFLMSRASPSIRKRWLAAAIAAQPEDRFGNELLGEWAGWDPKAALEAAVATGDAETLGRVASGATYGPFHGQPMNSCGIGFRVLREFDWSKLGGDLRKRALTEYGIEIMEQWGDIDIGEAARFAFDFVVETGYVPREELIRFFGGEDNLASRDDMVDRAFCSLRGWAAFKPAEFEKWIATIKDREMRQALTWILRDPWGPG